MCMFLDCLRKQKNTTWTKREQTLIHTLSITVEELVNPISPLFPCLLLPPYALLMDPDSSMRCFIAKIIFVWELQMWIQPCRLTAGTGLDLWLCVCVCECVWIVFECVSALCLQQHVFTVGFVPSRWIEKVSWVRLMRLFSPGTGLSLLCLSLIGLLLQ